MEKKIEVKDLRISFRTQSGTVKAVRNISFDLYKGETLAIVGESGSGKSVTSKAILGISAGNAIIESGQILYDGMDLLKITEDDFHRIRGDRIAMIFQDPLSSLNPIIRIGNQLTEAMLLKNAANKRRNRKLFYGTLNLIESNLINYYKEKQIDKTEHVKGLINTFKEFALTGTRLESAYNKAHQALVETDVDIDDLMLNVEKQQKIDVKAYIGRIIVSAKRVFDTFTIKEEDTDLPALIEALAVARKECKVGVCTEQAKELLKKISAIVKETLPKPAPDFFTLGYHEIKKPDFDLRSVSVEELDVITRKYLDEDFMFEFIEQEILALEHSYEQSIANKKVAIDILKDCIEYYNGSSIDKKRCAEIVKNANAAVDAAIDHLNVRKDTTSYVFASNLISANNTYWKAVTKNPKEIAKYEKQEKKYNALIAKGKTPDWKLIPAMVIDLDLAKKNIIEIMQVIINKYAEDIKAYGSYDYREQAIYTIDFLKEKASGVLYTVTPRMAKEIAIKLMEEVGIPEPRRRYKQYPFEFSGGMRQRIVIAIALAANPDILICDEPTTALDVTIQSQILELINRIKKERNLSIIFITHDLGVVANMADRIAVMYAGKIVECGTSEEIFYDPRHPYTWALLSSMPDLDTNEKLEAIPGTPPNMIYPPKGDAFAARNKYALNIDFEEEPPMFDITETHKAATWLLHSNAPKVEPPKIVTDRIQRMKEKGGIE